MTALAIANYNAARAVLTASNKHCKIKRHTKPTQAAPLPMLFSVTPIACDGLGHCYKAARKSRSCSFDGIQ